MAKGKEVAEDSPVKGAEGKALLHFDPRPFSPSNHEEMMNYLDEWCVAVGEGVSLRLCPRQTDYTKVPEDGGVYIPLLTLAIGAHLPLPPFARKVLEFYGIAPSQLSPGSWRVVLGFGALCQAQGLDFGVDEFRSIYRLVPGSKE